MYSQYTTIRAAACSSAPGRLAVGATGKRRLRYTCSGMPSLMAEGGPAAAAMGLLGGAALLLWGIERLSAALGRLAGPRLRRLLGLLTGSRLRGFLTGAGVTALTQSSTLVTVTLVGLASAGLVSLAQGIPVILGANIGTTITAQLIAFKLGGAALWIIAGGFALSLLRRWPRLAQAGEALIALGLIFLGLQVLGGALGPLKDNPAVQSALGSLGRPLPAFAAGLLLAALIHSSAGTIGIAIALAGAGLLSLPGAVAIGLGAEVGTCATALLAGLGRNVAARRMALAQFLFNAISAGLSLPLLGPLCAIAAATSADPGRQIANAMSLFNLAWALGFLCFSGGLARLVERLAPERPDEPGPLLPPKYLSLDYLAEPELAFAMLRRELLRAGRRIQPRLGQLLQHLAHPSPAALAGFEHLETEIGAHYSALTGYLGRISSGRLDAGQAAQFLGLLRAANGLHQISHLLRNLAEDQAASGEALAPGVAAYSAGLHAQVCESLRLALRAVGQRDLEAARQLSGQKHAVTAQLAALRLGAAGALNHGPPPAAGGGEEFAADYAQLMNLLEQLKRIFYYARRSARTILPEQADGAALPQSAEE